jgi:hypothetical protein
VGLLNSRTMTFWAGEFFAMRSYPVNCRIGSSIPGFSLLDDNTRSLSLSVTKKNVSRYCQMSPDIGGRERKSFLIETLSRMSRLYLPLSSY